MNSRERVLKAVNFEEPDRVPIDLGGMRASGISAVLYEKLKRRMGIEAALRWDESMVSTGHEHHRGRGRQLGPAWP